MKFSEVTMEDRGTKAFWGFGANIEYGAYELSIIKNEMSYGGSQGLYEIAVYMGDDQMELPGVTAEGDTVKGYLTEDDVDLIMYKMQLISGTVGVQK